jgi:hypothetical protein
MGTENSKRVPVSASDLPDFCNADTPTTVVDILLRCRPYNPMQRPPLTEREIEGLGTLDGPDLVYWGLRSLYALNRRAKMQRESWPSTCPYSRVKNPEMEIYGVYYLKDMFLDALVRAGLATVMWFNEATLPLSSPQACARCGRPVFGEDNLCYWCLDSAAAREDSLTHPEKWYLVRVGCYSWLVSEEFASSAIRRAAIQGRIEAPCRPPRHLPREELVLTAQVRAVREATKYLKRALIVGAWPFAEVGVEPVRQGESLEFAEDVPF